MLDLPYATSITDASRNAVSVIVDRLSSDVAAWRIDKSWWQGFSATKLRKEGVLDDHWVWEEEISAVRTNSFAEALSVTTRDGSVQGAIIYRNDAISYLDSNRGCSLVEFLASAPWNRKKLVESPRYFGVGLVLIKHVLRHSHQLGFQGRVVLASLPDPDTIRWYENRGFVNTGETITDDDGTFALFELSPAAAIHLLGDDLNAKES